MTAEFKNPMNNIVKSKSLQAFGFAVLVEVVLFLGAVGYSMMHVKTEGVATQEVITLAPEAPPELKHEIAKPKPKPEPSKPKKEIVPKPVKQKIIEPKPAPPIHPKPAEVKTPPTPVATPTAATEPAPPPPVAQPVVKSEVDPHVINTYAAKLLAAVQAATHCPNDVQFTGRVRVAFSLKNTDPRNVRVLNGSGVSGIDDAARHAVVDAAIPAPPAEMQGSERNYQTWVNLTCQ
jgi:outer membrane biosynthesis protein TonB